MSTIAGLHLRRTLGGRRMWIIVGFLLLPILLSASIRLVVGLHRIPSDQGDPILLYLFLLYPQASCMLLGLLDGALYVSTELEGRTLTYLFTRPVAKWRVVFEKYCTGVAVTLPFVLASLTATHAVLGFRGGPRVYVALVACTVAALLAYNAIFALIGSLVPRRSMVVCLIYCAVIEFQVSFVPVLLNQITASYYLRSMGLAISGVELPREAGSVFGTRDLSTAVIGLVAITAVGLLGSMFIVRNREFVMSEQV